jgi:hypothetical protein
MLDEAYVQCSSCEHATHEHSKEFRNLSHFYTLSAQRPERGMRCLPAGTSPQPIQSQCCVPSVPQPLRDLFCLESSISWTEFAIEQIGDFFGSTWFPDFVQDSRNVLVETTTRIRNPPHSRSSSPKVNPVYSRAFRMSVAAPREFEIIQTDRRELVGSNLKSTLRIASG